MAIVSPVELTHRASERWKQIHPDVPEPKWYRLLREIERLASRHDQPPSHREAPYPVTTDDLKVVLRAVSDVLSESRINGALGLGRLDAWYKSVRTKQMGSGAFAHVPPRTVAELRRLVIGGMVCREKEHLKLQEPPIAPAAAPEEADAAGHAKPTESAREEPMVEGGDDDDFHPPVDDHLPVPPAEEQAPAVGHKEREATHSQDPEPARGRRRVRQPKGQAPSRQSARIKGTSNAPEEPILAVKKGRGRPRKKEETPKYEAPGRPTKEQQEQKKAERDKALREQEERAPAAAPKLPAPSEMRETQVAIPGGTLGARSKTSEPQPRPPPVSDAHRRSEGVDTARARPPVSAQPTPRDFESHKDSQTKESPPLTSRSRDSEAPDSQPVTDGSRSLGFMSPGPRSPQKDPGAPRLEPASDKGVVRSDSPAEFHAADDVLTCCASVNELSEFGSLQNDRLLS